MSKKDTPVFKHANPGDLIKSEDWNELQLELRYALRYHKHKRDDPNITDDEFDKGQEDNARPIDTDELADGAVTTAKISDKAVTSTKLESDADDDEKRAVTTDHIKDEAVTTEKLASNVTIGKAKDADTVDGKHAADFAPSLHTHIINTANIQNGAVTTEKLANDIMKTLNDIKSRLEKLEDKVNPRDF